MARDIQACAPLLHFEEERVAKGPSQHAFTLVELLVVIAIIAVLASLLVPALARGKAQGQKAFCISNFRQLQLAWQMYIDDQDRRLPVNVLSLGAGEIEGFPNWVAGILQIQDGWQDNTNTVKLIKAHGGIGAYLSDPRVFKCPSDRSMARIAGKLHPRARSVAMNLYMGFNNSPLTEEICYSKITDFNRGLPIDSGFVLIDTHEDSITTGLYNTPIPSGWGSGWNHFPGSRHNGGATLSFTDGHVICHKWQDPRTIQPARNKVLYGVVQPNNRDMQWLRDRGTTKNPTPY